MRFRALAIVVSILFVSAPARTPVGRLERGLDEGGKRGWALVA